MPTRRTISVAAALLAVTLLGGCGAENDEAEPLDTTTSTGAPTQGDSGGASTGADGDTGGGRAIDPGSSTP